MINIKRFRMSVAVLSITGTLAALASPAAWGELQRTNMVDRIRVDPETNQATLVLVTDLPLEGEDAPTMLEERSASIFSTWKAAGCAKIVLGFQAACRWSLVYLVVSPTQRVRDYVAGIRQVLEKRGYEI